MRKLNIKIGFHHEHDDQLVANVRPPDWVSPEAAASPLHTVNLEGEDVVRGSLCHHRAEQSDHNHGGPCRSGGGQSGRTWLDLSGLTFVDQAGAKLLKDLIRGGIAVSACSGFVAELLHLENS